eukprot:scaffold162899_cov30-Tisochrysis_lutea.AAC.1
MPCAVTAGRPSPMPGAKPALSTRVSSRCVCFVTCAAKLRTRRRSVRSRGARTGSAVPPLAKALRRTSAAAASHALAERQPSSTRAPRSAAARPTARPMPELPPVMSKV